MRADVGLLVVSGATLTLEVLQTRIFAFSLDPLTIYLAIGICLLGLGGAGTLLALRGPASQAAVLRWGATFAALAAPAVIVAHVVFADGSRRLTFGGPGSTTTLLALTTPYLCLGMVTTLLLMAPRAAIGRIYAINLVGSGLGCLAVFPLLDHLGAERALVCVAALAAAGALLLAPLGSRTVISAGVAATIALGVTAWKAPGFLRFAPDPQGQLSQLIATAETLSSRRGVRAQVTPLFTRWDRTARVDVSRLESSDDTLQSRIGGPVDTLFFAQDASAGSLLLGLGDDLTRGREFFERTVYGAAYARGPARRLLVVGLGGAPDVQAALYHRAAHIDAVEINRATIDLVRRDFRDFLGDPYGRPEVTVHQMDGRTFARLTDRTYDVIQMSGADTKSLHASGSLSVNENYLYTREGMREFLERLEPEGVLSIIRFVWDADRLVTTAVAALRDLGATAPEQHFFATRQGKTWVSILIKRSPFITPEIKALHRWVQRSWPDGPAVVIPAYDWSAFSLRTPLYVLYSPPPRAVFGAPVFRSLAEKRIDAYEAQLAAKGIDISAPSDDRPFFFFRQTRATALGFPPTSAAFKMFYHLLPRLTAIAALLIVLPLVVWRGRGLGAPQAPRALVYFACLGGGFMLVEIGLIHRFVLLLGHQSYAITVVLFGLLAGAGAGSLLSARLGATPASVALVALIAVILTYAFALPAVFAAAASTPFALRLALALLLLAVLGLALGIPFPSALRTVASTSPALVAWAVGINGFASVVGATLAIPLAMIAGLRAVLLLGAALYTVALLTRPTAAVS